MPADGPAAFPVSNPATGHDHVCEQTRTGQSALDRTMGSWLLNNTVTTGATEFRPYRANHFEAAWHKFQRFRHVLAQAI